MSGCSSHVHAQRLWQGEVGSDEAMDLYPLHSSSSSSSSFVVVRGDSLLVLFDVDEFAASSFWSSSNLNSAFDLSTRCCSVHIQLDRPRRLQQVAVSTSTARIAAIDTLHTMVVWSLDGEVLLEESLRIPSSSVCVGIYWLGTHLLLSTSDAALLYRVDADASTPLLLKVCNRSSTVEWILQQQMCVSVRSHAEAHSHAAALLLSREAGSPAFEVWHATRTMKLVCRFRIPELEKAHDDTLKQRLWFVQIYGKASVVVADGDLCKMYLYQLEDAVMRRVRMFELFAPGVYSVCVVDDVIVAFNHDVKVLLLYDMFLGSSSPIVAPLPLEIDESVKDQIYAGEWQMLLPNLVAVKNGRHCLGTWKFLLNLRNIASSWGHRDLETLVQFLMRRNEAEEAIVSTLRHMICHPEHVRALSYSLSTLVRAIAVENANEPASSTFIRTTITQANMVKAFRECVGVADEHLEVVCLEFLHCLTRHHCVPVEEFVGLFVDVLTRQGRYMHLQQFLQYHLFPDSSYLAKRLIQIGATECRPALQFGLDMLSRIKDFPAILQYLLSANRVMSALRFIESEKRFFDAHWTLISVSEFLKAALASGDLEVFYETFRYFRANDPNKELEHNPDVQKYIALSQKRAAASSI